MHDDISFVVGSLLDCCGSTMASVDHRLDCAEKVFRKYERGLHDAARDMELLTNLHKPPR